MPAKNALKTYVKDAYYHIYNRGVNKCTIFKNKQDHKTFLSFLKLYLSPRTHLKKDPSPTIKNSLSLSPSKKLKNHSDKITLLTHCEMPNHFHLLVKQHTKDAINYFMRSFATKYVRYFNSRHNRVGSLFQGRYKAVLINSEEQFLYLTKYIHRNPLSLPTYEDSPRRLSEYPYSSYQNYLGLINQPWVKPKEILSHFSKTSPYNNYQSFVEEKPTDQQELSISHLTLE